MLIEDGAGSGYKAKVGTDNRLKTIALTRSVEHQANHADGQGYNVLFAGTPAGAGDCFFYMKNNSDTDIVIEGVTHMVASAESIYYNISDTGTLGGTSDATVPANLNAGSGNVADVTCETVIGDAAVDITGLSGGTKVQQYWLTTTQSTYINLDQDIIIPKNKTFTMWAVTGGVVVRGTVVFHFHDVV